MTCTEHNAKNCPYLVCILATKNKGNEMKKAIKRKLSIRQRIEEVTQAWHEAEDNGNTPELAKRLYSEMYRLEREERAIKSLARFEEEELRKRWEAL